MERFGLVGTWVPMPQIDSFCWPYLDGGYPCPGSGSCLRVPGASKCHPFNPYPEWPASSSRLWIEEETSRGSSFLIETICLDGVQGPSLQPEKLLLGRPSTTAAAFVCEWTSWATKSARFCGKCSETQIWWVFNFAHQLNLEEPENSNSWWTGSALCFRSSLSIERCGLVLAAWIRRCSRCAPREHSCVYWIPRNCVPADSWLRFQAPTAGCTNTVNPKLTLWFCVTSSWTSAWSSTCHTWFKSSYEVTFETIQHQSPKSWTLCAMFRRKFKLISPFVGWSLFDSLFTVASCPFELWPQNCAFASQESGYFQHHQTSSHENSPNAIRNLDWEQRNVLPFTRIFRCSSGASHERPCEPVVRAAKVLAITPSWVGNFKRGEKNKVQLTSTYLCTK